MQFSEFLKQNHVLLDGGTGTVLQSYGLQAGELPELWNLTHREKITELHKAYFDAGSNVVCSNTFGANRLKFSDTELEEIVKAALENAQEARRQSTAPQEKFVALDIGPCGKLLRPYGDLDFEDAVSLFAATVKLGVKYGADLILIETMNDSYETKAAMLAAKENSDLPVLVSNVYGEDGKLLTGATPAAMAAMLEGLGADAIGANCSLGPKQLRKVVEELLACASVPVLLKPNAGMPKSVDGKTIFDVEADEFADEAAEFVKKGVRLIGGCCGTTPAYIRAVAERIRDIEVLPVAEKERTVVSSYTHAVTFGDDPLLIGERINPTGKKRLQQALKEGDIAYILNEGVNQQEKGAHILDVNVGLPEIDERAMLERAVCELQAVVDAPLQIDTSDIAAMEIALRRYNGKAMINSVNGKKESMERVFPLAKKYGGVIVALTLDENGIPDTAEGRIEIAERIVTTAEKYGISKKDLVFDTLAMTISAEPKAATVTVEALKGIRQRLGCHTSLGISNISFGLPNRDAVNATFFALALENGLSATIMNPYSADMMKTYYAYRALKGLDRNCADYIERAATFVAAAPTAAALNVTNVVNDTERGRSELQNAIVKGFKERAGEITKQLLLGVPALELVDKEIIPALDIVGEGFEQKRVYLPQLLMSAEAAKSAFEEIKKHLAKDGANGAQKATFVLATVRGDIHDIGKNIVKLLLENYGFHVIDLGKDVPAEAIVKATVEAHAPFVGLSALMTTTVPAMEETIEKLRCDAPWCKIVVGGAVLTAAYAEKIGADHYAKDAMETVRYAEKIVKAENEYRE